MNLLRALATFKRIVELGSFSAAARASGSSQSAVAREIKALENHFGLRLFHRTTRHLTLTDDGQDLLDSAHRLLEMAGDMETALGRHRSSATGLVRLGLSAAAATLLVPRLEALFEHHPGLSIELVVANQFPSLVKDRLDVALQVGGPSDTSTVARVVGTVGKIAVATSSYLQRHGAPAHPDELSEHACIIHETGPDSARWRFSGPDGPIEVAVSGPIRTNYVGAVHRAALAGLGIAYLPEQVVHHDLSPGYLCRLLDAYPSEATDIYVTYPSHRHLAPRTRAVIDFLVDEMKPRAPAKAAASPMEQPLRPAWRAIPAASG
jgi:DNA-binding transcriptional LysR family regulator